MAASHFPAECVGEMMDFPVLSAEAYALAQAWVPRMSRGHLCAVHVEQCDYRGAMLEWQRFPRSWQMEMFGQLLENDPVWLCPNAWFLLSDLTRLARDVPEVLVTSDPLMWAWRLASEALHALDAVISQQPEHAKRAPTASTPEDWRCSRCGGRMHYTLRGFWHSCGATAAEKAEDTREEPESPTHGESPTPAHDVAQSEEFGPDWHEAIERLAAASGFTTEQAGRYAIEVMKQFGLKPPTEDLLAEADMIHGVLVEHFVPEVEEPCDMNLWTLSLGAAGIDPSCPRHAHLLTPTEPTGEEPESAATD